MVLGAFRYGSFSLHTVFAKIVFRKCASCSGGEHNFKKMKNQRKIVSISIENKKLDRNGKNEEQIMNAKRVQMGPKSNKEDTLWAKHRVLQRF